MDKHNFQESTHTDSPQIGYFAKVYFFILGVIKNPATIGRQFVIANDFKVVFSLIGIHSLSIGLLVTSSVLKLNAMITNEFDSFGYTDSSESIFSLVPAILFSMSITFIFALILPAILFAVQRLIGIKTTYSQMLCVSGVNSIMITPFIFMGFLLNLVMLVNVSIYPMSPVIIPLLALILGVALGSCTIIKLLKVSEQVNDDKSIYILFFSGVVMSLITYYTLRFTLPLFLPETLSYFYSAARIIGI